MQLADGVRRLVTEVGATAYRVNGALATRLRMWHRSVTPAATAMAAGAARRCQQAWHRLAAGLQAARAARRRRGPTTAPARSLRTALTAYALACGHEIGGTLVRFAVYCAVLGGGTLAVWTLANSLFGEDPDGGRETRDWVAVDRPAPAFALDMAGFVTGEPRYLIERHRSGGGRRDRLVWDGASNDRSLLIEIYRPGDETVRALSFDTTATGGRPLLARGGDPVASRLGSAFGPVTLTGNPLRGRDGRICLGFGADFADPRVRLSGVTCGPGSEEEARIVLACSLDRLRLVSAGGDPRLAGLFARAALARTACAPGKPPKAAGPPPALWLEGTAAPPLRRADRTALPARAN